MIGTSLGIEISGKDLRIAAVQHRLRKLQLLYVDEVSNFADLPPDEQKTAVRNLIKKHRLSPGRVFLSLPRDRGIVRQIELPNEVGDNLKSAVSLQIESLCPWPTDEIYWSFAHQELKSPGKIVVTVVIVPRANLDPWVDFFKSIQLPLSGASLSPATCAHGIRALWPDTNPTIALDCESGYVDGLLVNSGQLISIRETGEDTGAKARGAVEQLLGVGRVQSPEQARLLMYGAGIVSVEGVEDLPLPLENAPANASSRFGAIASALSGVKKTGFDCNPLPAELRFHRSQLRLVPTYVFLLMTLLLGSAMLLRQPYQSTAYASQLDDEIKAIAPEARHVSAQAAELDRLALRYRVLLANLQQKDYVLESLRELAVSLPPTAWLTSFTYQEGVVTVSGTAVSASEVQKILEDTALFKDVQFTSTVSRDPDGRERFSIKAPIEVPR
jgi:Tfp pilus assembly protein PilN